MRKIVDIWVGVIATRQNFDAYVEESYEDDTEVISPFAADQNETFYDHDFMELAFFEASKSLEDILKPLSYSSGFISAALKRGGTLPVSTFNCVFADYDSQFDDPRSVEKDGISITYLGRFKFGPGSISVSEQEENERLANRPFDADIAIDVRSGSVVFEGKRVESILVKASEGLLFGSGHGPSDRPYLDIGEFAPEAAALQAEIQFSPVGGYWEFRDLASNGVTHYRKEPLNGERVAPFAGIRFSFGTLEFAWRLP